MTWFSGLTKAASGVGKWVKGLRAPKVSSASWTRTWKDAEGVVNVAKVNVGKAGAAAGRTLISWGNTVKVAVVAAAGVVAAKWAGSGIPDAIAHTLGCSTEQATWIAAILFIIGVGAVVVFIDDKIRARRGLKPRELRLTKGRSKSRSRGRCR